MGRKAEEAWNSVQQEAGKAWDTVKQEAGELWEGVKIGAVQLGNSLKDTAISLYEDPLGTGQEMLYNATIGTVEEIWNTGMWAGRMLFSNEYREKVAEDVKAEVDSAGGWSNYLGQAAALIVGEVILNRAGIRGRGPLNKKHDDRGGGSGAGNGSGSGGGSGSGNGSGSGGGDDSGDPGGDGDKSGDEGTPKAHYLRTVNKFEDQIRKEPLEHGQFFDKNGNLIGETVVGTEKSINLSKHKDIAKDTVFTHNHPTNGPFSLEDIATAVDFNMAEIRAVSPNGTTLSGSSTLSWTIKMRACRINLSS
ncbi:hypothetical protein [Paenibacillus sp. FSL M8-0142]|uniref:hypothetical protein n=1 Tax=Paenibacillus sp. FSL M8-0142 TaxID=2954525 RepID=UPI00315A8BAF